MNATISLPKNDTVHVLLNVGFITNPLVTHKHLANVKSVSPYGVPVIVLVFQIGKLRHAVVK